MTRQTYYRAATDNQEGKDKEEPGDRKEGNNRNKQQA